MFEFNYALLLAQDFTEGGLKLTHLKSYIRALKVKWIKTILSGDESIVSIFREIFGETMEKIVWIRDH